jgi:deoxycytidine triphosphate deaminase
MFGSHMIEEQMEQGRIKIEGSPPLLTGEAPYLQPVSYELTLGSEFAVGFYRPTNAINYWIKPGEFLLGHTTEVVTLSPEVAATVHGKSTLGRRGLAVHVTAGLIDPGFSGQITLEMVNHSEWDIELTPGMRICQVTFDFVTGGCVPYGDPSMGNHYQNQRGATPAA